ncbi:hypothetical protein F4810DRAFT_724305 [Camillea tinctor]|nr:hypothetical protein F4810DRAFT_724305 [Camillea tinctor]
MPHTMESNQFPECNAIHEGRPCPCATCNRARLNNMMDFNGPSQGGNMQQLVETSSSMGSMAYTRDTPQHMLFDEQEEESNRQVAPYAPMEDTAMEYDTKAAPGEINSIFNQQQHLNNYFEPGPRLPPGPLSFPNIAPRPSTGPEPLSSSSPNTPAPDPGDTTPNAVHQPGSPSSPRRGGPPAPPRRKGRASKYGPHSSAAPSPYGPPFTTLPLTKDMPEPEIHRRIEHNAAVAEARRAYLRAKNNAAAKRSRERKQRLIEELTADVDRLELRNEQMAAANRELVAAVGTRSHALEAENARLRAENDALRVHVAEMAARVGRAREAGDTTREDGLVEYPLMVQQQQQVQTPGEGSAGGGASVEAVSPHNFDLEALFGGMPQSQPQFQNQQLQDSNNGLGWDGFSHS